MAFGYKYMISIEELNEVKEKRKTNLYYEEKEYLQYIFLNSISKHEEFVFKGGTCLRICYGFDRASEDLDFNSNLNIKEIKEIIKKCLEDFKLLNIDYEIYSEKEFGGNLRIEARFKGPLFSGNKHSTNTLKIDFNKSRVKNKKAKVIQKLFSDVPAFTILVMNEKEIFAEKIRAFVNRGEPRDLYDLWILINNHVEVDKKLIYQKLKEEKDDISNLKFPSREEYERDLKNLVLILPDYEQVKKEVEEVIRETKKK